ncbi:hypothetical protein PYW07_003137 [Mythimna separata]|uniref:Uncharacterized protein n=1 Tax=Mythimna separata TaxID=271217 RepID=A0AAD7YIL9_MYTSE|nr:hypothetical protein PYW07_003137 [Mythimna separata]
MFRLLTLLSTLVVSTLGLYYAPGLKVRFDFACVGIGTKAFIELPQNTTVAAASGWVQKTRPDSPVGFETLELWCPSTDYTVCLLFDDTGYVAGMQIAFDEELVSNAEYDWTVQGYTNWTTTMNDTTENYFTVQQYYVSKETLAKAATCKAARDSSLLLQEDSLWVSGINGELFEISTKASDITGGNSLFTKQQCIPRMGYHYYYNMTTSSECIDKLMFPWFPLIDHDQLIGIGFNLFGQYTPNTGSTNWFEYSGETAVRYTIPNGPDCLYEIAGRVGQVTMHTYFIESPYNVVCMA